MGENIGRMVLPSPPRSARFVARRAAFLCAGILGFPFAFALPVAAQDREPLVTGTVVQEGAPLGDFLRPQGYTALALRRNVGPHLEVTAKINGVTGRFLVDTGAQITVVDSHSLRRFHLSSVKTGVRVIGAVGGPGERIEAALASTLQIGPCSTSPFLLGVSDLGALNQGRPRGGGPFDGIIGADVLQNFSFVIDCAGLQLYAKPSTGGAGGGLGRFLEGYGYRDIAMKRASISDFEVMANVNGRRVLWLVDTGAAITLLDSTVSRKAGIKLKRTNFTVGGAGGGRRRIDIGIVDNLKLSSVQVGSAVIAASDISVNGALNEPGKVPIDGYLGADFLREKHAVIDCAQMRLYVRGKGR